MSAANGDFVQLPTDTSFNAPMYAFLGPTSAGAILFDPRSDGLGDRLEAGIGAFPTNSFYGTSDWSVEM